MSIDLEIFNALKRIKQQLLASDMAALEASIHEIGLDRLLSSEFIEAARTLDAPELVTFIATLGSENAENPAPYQRLLYAYMVMQGRLKAKAALTLAGSAGERPIYKQLLIELENAKLAESSSINISADLKATKEEWQETLSMFADAKLFDLFKTYAAIWIKKSKDELSWLIASRQLAQRSLYLSNSDPVDQFAAAMQYLLRKAPHKYASIRNQIALDLAETLIQLDFAEKAKSIVKIIPEEDQNFQAKYIVVRSDILNKNLAAATEKLGDLVNTISLERISTLTDEDFFDADKKGSFNTGDAEFVLKDLNKILREKNLAPFLMSGTLLGCIREKSILKHDKDIDIGIIGWENQYGVAKALLDSGNYKFKWSNLTGENLYLIGMSHIRTGMAVDIFFFHERENDFRHGIDSRLGYTQHFNFSKFKLIETEFLGEAFWIPDNFDQNLTENYGDWKTPMPDYIVTLESPALEAKSGETFKLVANLELLRIMGNKAGYKKAEKILKIAKNKTADEVLFEANTINLLEIWIDREKTFELARHYPEKAFPDIESNNAKKPGDTLVLAQKVIAEIGLKKWDAAITTINQLTKIVKNNIPRGIYACLSTALHHVGKYSEAESNAIKGLQEQYELIKIKNSVYSQEQYEEMWQGKTTPKVSIICTTFNHERYLEQTLCGFFSQKTSFPFEVLIHDDASSDGSQAIIKKWQEQYPAIIKSTLQTENQFSKGFRPFDFLLSKASGSYIAICEGDDYWISSEKLQMQVDFLDINPEFICTAHNYYHYDEEKLLIRPWIKTNEDRIISADELMKLTRLLWVHTLMFRNVFSAFPAERNQVPHGDSFLTSFLGTMGNCMYFEGFLGAVGRRNSHSSWTPLDKSRKNQLRNQAFVALSNLHQRLGNQEVAEELMKKILPDVIQLAA